MKPHWRLGRGQCQPKKLDLKLSGLPAKLRGLTNQNGSLGGRGRPFLAQNGWVFFFLAEAGNVEDGLQHVVSNGLQMEHVGKCSLHKMVYNQFEEVASPSIFNPTNQGLRPVEKPLARASGVEASAPRSWCTSRGPHGRGFRAPAMSFEPKKKKHAKQSEASLLDSPAARKREKGKEKEKRHRRRFLKFRWWNFLTSPNPQPPQPKRHGRQNPWLSWSTSMAKNEQRNKQTISLPLIGGAHGGSQLTGVPFTLHKGGLQSSSNQSNHQLRGT